MRAVSLFEEICVIQVSLLSGRDLRHQVANLCSLFGYVSGNCYQFAIALHRGLGLPLVGIVVGESVIHAGVEVAPLHLYRDARGELPSHKFVHGFDGYGPYSIEYVDEGRLFELYRKENRVELQEELIREARRHAEATWPDLPWRDARKLEKFEHFTSELEALCRKHGIWLREQVPTTAPILYELDEEDNPEKGFTLEQLQSTSSQFLLKRLL